MRTIRGALLLLLPPLLLLAPAPAEARTPQRHTIRPGDTLTELGRRYGQSVAELKRRNRIPDADFILAGKTLRLRGPRRSWAQPAPPMRTAAPAAPAAPAPSAAAAPPPAAGGSADWLAIAECESGGNWGENAGTIYDGGLQFHPATWLGFGGGAYAPEAWQASPAQQIAVAERVLASQGPGAWPNCFAW